MSDATQIEGLTKIVKNFPNFTSPYVTDQTWKIWVSDFEKDMFKITSVVSIKCKPNKQFTIRVALDSTFKDIENEEPIHDPDTDFKWLFINDPSLKQTIDSADFQIAEVVVDGKYVLPAGKVYSREKDSFSQHVPIPREFSRNNDVLLEFKFSVMQHRSIGAVVVSTRWLTKGFKVDFNYSDSPLSKVHAFPLMTGELQQVIPKKIQTRHNE